MIQSTWAVAAQYCQHENSINANHIGHHTHKHDNQNDTNISLTDNQTTDNSKSKADTDCPYCHLGSIKSIINTLPTLNAAVEPVAIIDIYYSYPEIIPLKPERPNWNLAA